MKMRDVLEVQVVYGPGNRGLPGPQTINTKKANVSQSKDRIATTKKLWKSETNISEDKMQRVLADESVRKEYLKTVTPKVRRCVEIIIDNSEMIKREEQAIAIFKRHSERQHAELKKRVR